MAGERWRVENVELNWVTGLGFAVGQAQHLSKLKGGEVYDKVMIMIMIIIQIRIKVMIKMIVMMIILDKHINYT